MRTRRRKFKTIGSNPLENLPGKVFDRRGRRKSPDPELETAMRAEMREVLEPPPGFARRFLRRLLRLFRAG